MLVKIIFILCLSFVGFAEESFHVFFVKGKASVFILNAKGQFEESSLRPKMTVKTPFRIVTYSNSLVVIKSKTKTNKIESDSKIDFMESEDISHIDIKQGTFLSNFLNSNKSNKSRLIIKSRTASLGVRGTTFAFYADKNSDKNFLSVKEGVVSYQAKNSNQDVEVSRDNSVTLNERLQNLKPNSYEFQKYINWNLEDTSQPMDQPKSLYTSFNKVWSEYKKEQEFLWENRNKEMNDKWKSMSKQ